MQRRTEFLVTLPALAALVRAELAEAVPLQDVEWVQGWEQAQRLRPAKRSSRARIAAANELGTPLVLHGTVFQRDGRSPAPGITVFAYHTDFGGHYEVPGSPPHRWRLKGWAVSDAAGHFEFETIRPAPYPGRNIAAHVHLTIEGPQLPRRYAPEINFADDALVPQAVREQSTRDGRFGSVRAVTVRDGVQHVDFSIRIVDEGKF